MAAIKTKDTKPEVLVRRSLHAAGLRYSLHQKDLPGKPDVVLRRRKVAVFVHGCFWHHHGCANSVWPVVRAEFWRKKINANIRRDSRNRRRLRAIGWRVVVIWECEVNRASKLQRLVARVSVPTS